MKSIHRFFISTIISMLVCITSSFTQETQVTIRAIVLDEAGNPVAMAAIYGNEGRTLGYTNDSGEFSIEVGADDMLIIEADNYEPIMKMARLISTGDNIILETKPFHMKEKDQTAIAYGSMTKRQFIGAISVINAAEISPFDNQQSVADAIRGRVPGYHNHSLRGQSGILIVVDGIPRSSTSQGSDFNFLDNMNMQEIEQITFLKDATASLLYGSKAKDGVILITTKRGQKFKNILGVRAEKGIRTPVSYPEYLNAADYMYWNNRARANDGLSPRYTQAEIDNTRQGTDRIKFPDESFFNSRYLKNFSNYFRLSADASGGNDRATYYSMVTWDNSRDLFALEQEGKKFNNNKINFRGNVNYTIADWFKASLDAFVHLGADRQPLYDFWSYASTRLPNSYPMLIPLSVIGDSLLPFSAKVINDEYVLGGTNQYLDNIYGEFVLGGFSTLISRMSQFNFGMDFDLNAITTGLTAKTHFGYDFMNDFNLSYINQYAVYERSYIPSLINGADSLIVNKIGIDRVNRTQNLSNVISERRFALFSTIDYQRTFDEKHQVVATLNGYWNQTNPLGRFYSDKQNNFGLRANYLFDKRYIAQISAAMIGSGYLPEGDRYKLGYSAGLGWVISEEGFFSDDRFIKYLKVNASYGKIYSDMNFPGYYLYNSSFTGGGNLLYNRNLSSNSARVYSNLASPSLGLASRNDLNIGIEAMLAENRVWIEADYFISTSDGNVVRKANVYPEYYAVLPYENFERFQDKGIDLGITFREKAGDFRYQAGFNISHIIPKAILVDEPDFSDTPYRRLQGQPYDAIFGFVAEGLFRDSAQVASSPSQSALGNTGPGDIKYKDLNNDGVIDEKDQQIIGYRKPRVQYSLNISLSYRNISLYAMGTGQSGSDVIFKNSYYWQTGQTTKYSTQILDSWTTETANTATYPILHLNAADNNHVNSTFWLDKNNVFRIHTLQLSYNVAPNTFSSGKGFHVYLRGSNLLTISPISKKLDLNIGSAPQMRSFAIGIDMLF
jgi:TonB-linked SusC/RagA family outer membrane protein